MNSKPVTRLELILLILLTLTGFALRLSGIGSLSLAEDEANKWIAIQEYREGRFVGVNSEHPMLLKLLAWWSIEFGETWNRWAAPRGWPQVREEAWLRLPNVVFGAVTTIAIFLLARQMFGSLGAWAASFLWAVTPLAIALNRILKEDTLLTFFTLLAFYFFWRGKTATSPSLAGRWFCLSVACFGLALASKYFIHYLGLNLVAWHVAGRWNNNHQLYLQHFWRSMLFGALAFLLANPVILSPSNDALILNYMGENRVSHHGYFLNGELFLNSIGTTPFGLPWYFYFWVLAVKIPIPVLVAFVGGLVLVLFDGRSPAAIFLRVMLLFWFLPHALAGVKFVRYVLILLPFVFLTAGFAFQKLADWLGRRERSTPARLAPALALVALCLSPLGETLAIKPFYGLYLNALGGGQAKAARYFPHDEVYDLGTREAVEEVCREAPRDATFASSNPAAITYYLRQCGRSDIRAVALYDPAYVPRAGHYLLAQDSRRYYETADLLDLLDRRGGPATEIRVNGLLTGRIYRF